MSKVIGNSIRHYRVQQGHTQADMSKAVGLTVNFLSQVENGHKAPSLKSLSMISGFLGVKLEEFVKDDPVMNELRALVHEFGKQEIERCLREFDN